MADHQEWYSHGKLLISGEYLVMEGAKAFALPLKQGQSLVLTAIDDKGLLSWNALQKDASWFHAIVETEKFAVINTDNQPLAENLIRILQAVRKLSPDFLKDGKGISVETNLDFNPEFGFGSSSTLISNLAWWAGVNPYELLRLTFGGSGYDIACARLDSPVFFQLEASHPLVEEVEFKPVFSNQLYFVYLGKKQKSTESIQSFKAHAVFGKDDLKAISLISQQLVSAKSLQEFEELLNGHEKRMAVILKRPTVKSLLFADAEGAVKSLGGWGGDFVLITNHQSDIDFRADMKKRGFPIVFGFNELVL